MVPTKLQTDTNEILKLIATNLDLNETRYQNAKEKYRAIANWLNGENSLLAPYSPTIYPQGSFVIGTVVKPLSTDEDYDIDLVCELSNIQEAPQHVKSIVGNRLSEHETYREMLEEKNRCWRLNYAGEFHMDILPALSSSFSETAIRVPDKNLQAWKDSDPKGYASWFKTQMQQQFTLLQKALAESERKNIEEIPDFRVKTTLQLFALKGHWTNIVKY
jgi:hypothetical protein